MGVCIVYNIKMMEVNLVFIILLAGLVAPIVGFVWYHPRVFGSMWIRLVNISPENLETRKRKAPILSIIAFVSAVLMAFVFTVIGATIVSAVFVWVGFVVPVMLWQVLWEGRPVKLFTINASYWLVVLCLMAFIIGGLM